MDNIFFDLRKLKYLGVNAIVGKTVRIRRPEECIIGDGAIVDEFAYVSCSIEIGRYCHIASHVSISGGAGKLTLGAYSTISNHCSVHCASSDYVDISLDLPSVPPDLRFGGTVGDVVIDDYVVVGAHSCVLPGVRLPRGAAFGAYSLIANVQYQPMCLYVGIPAKLHKKRSVPLCTPEELRRLLEGSSREPRHPADQSTTEGSNTRV
ncbi:MAG: hypothetical protein ABJA98_10295 [Acidobacteriota bacterium]